MDIRGELGISSRTLVVTFLGQVRLIKGVRTLLRAIQRIERREVLFVIAGEFREPSSEFTEEQFLAAVASDDRIRYLGYRSDPQNIYESSDVIVVPSLYDEPCSMVLFEAAAARKPVVASATGGTPEIIENGFNGLLFERDDDEGLAGAIGALLSDASLRRRMGASAYQRATTDFLRAPVGRLEQLYEDIYQAKPGKPALRTA